MIFPNNKYRVEPGNVHHIHYISSINIANVERTHAIPPRDCIIDEMPDTYVTNKIPDNNDYFIYDSKYVYPYKRDIIGNVTIVPGFNCSVIKVTNNNELQIIASKGNGYSMIEQQRPYPIYDGEEIPSKSNMYSGGIKCTDTIKAINGINKKTVPIIAGPGIEYEVEDNTIYLDVDMNAVKGSCEDECGNTN